MKKDTKQESKFSMVVQGKSKLGDEALNILSDMLTDLHVRLACAKIGLAWRYGAKESADGIMPLGKAHLMGDFGQSISGYDAVIELNFDWFSEAPKEQREALIDHELCHIAVSTDENDDEKTWADGRPVLRVRKHDLEEFNEIVKRHGQWKTDIQVFVKTAAQGKFEFAQTV